MEAVTIVFVILCVLLIIVLLVEIREYRLYRKAALAVIALGESMKVSFTEVVNHLNRINEQSNMLGAGLNVAEQDINLLKSMSSLHSQALNLQDALKNFKLHEELLRIETNGEEDGIGEIQR